MINSTQLKLKIDLTVSDEKFKDLIIFFENIYERYTKDQLAFVCIGTDRSTGDSFGPLVGSMLASLGFSNVYGTIDNPCDADHVQQVIAHLQQTNKIVVAFDACLGSEASIGSFITTNGSLVPGAGVGRTLPPVGHYSVAAIVNKRGLKSYWQLQHTSLFFIYRMVYTLECAINTVWNERNIK